MSLRHCLIALLLLASRSAFAASCSITTTGTLIDFGRYSAMTSSVDSQALLNFVCTPTALGEVMLGYDIKVSPGLSGNALDRRLYLNGDTGGNSLRYNLFTEASRITVWGDGSGGTSFYSGSCTVALCPVTTVYGRLLGGQGGTPGAYRDSVGVSINF